MQAPKNGFFYVLDRLTGEFISAEPFATTTWATAIDRSTGRPIESASARYGAAGAWISPATGGASNWQPMSWHPDAALAYISGRNNVQYFRSAPSFEPQPGQFNTGLAPNRAGEKPPIAASGFLLAWDPALQRERWRVAIAGLNNAGTLATGGGLVFHGTQAGAFRAHDALTGQILWESQLAPGIATPVAFRIDGRQYISVLAGGVLKAPSRVWTFTLGDEPAR
jgi:outer membrane protein assembly factor BamB